MEQRAKASAQREVREALRHGATEAELRAHGGSAKGMCIDLGVMRAEGGCGSVIASGTTRSGCSVKNSVRSASRKSSLTSLSGLFGVTAAIITRHE